MSEEISTEGQEQKETVDGQNPQPSEETKAPQKEETPTEGQKPEENYKQGMFKYKGMYEDLKKDTDAQMKVVEEKAVKGEITPEQQDEALGKIRSLIQEELAPIKQGLDAGEQKESLARVMEMPYSKALEPEITAEFKKFPDSMPFGERLEAARNAAIGANLEKITQINQDIGKEQAYSNQNTKGDAGRTVGETASNAGRTEKPALETLKEGMTDKEYASNRDEILKQEKEGILGN